MLLSVLDSMAKVKITEQIIESIEAVSLLIIHQIWKALQKGIESKMSNATLRASQNGLTITFVVSSTNNRYLQMSEEFLGDDWPDLIPILIPRWRRVQIANSISGTGANRVQMK